MTRRSIAIALAAAACVLLTGGPGPYGLGRLSAQGNLPSLPALTPPAHGAFRLVDHAAHAVGDEDFRGRFMLVFFGYTYCPDVCPTGLQMLSDAMDILGAAGDKVQPILITVDPERDTPEVLTDYVRAFHPRLIGLTGTPEQVKAAATAYGARYFKLYDLPFEDDEDDQTEEADENADYALSHTAHTYLVGPDGRGLVTFPHGTWPQDMADQIRRYLDKAT